MLFTQDFGFIEASRRSGMLRPSTSLSAQVLHEEEEHNDAEGTSVCLCE